MDATLLPRSTRARDYEIKALALREFAGLRFDDEPLDPFRLARYAKLLVVPFDEIKGLSAFTRGHLLGEGRDSWSGGAASLRLPDGRKLIILNPTHSKVRQNATLMEEICHVFLGHKPSRLSAARPLGNSDRARDYDRQIEEEAYGVGSAALLPFSALRRITYAGMTSAEIARHFAVSRALVEYRLKITLLWDEYKSRAGKSTDK